MKHTLTSRVTCLWQPAIQCLLLPRSALISIIVFCAFVLAKAAVTEAWADCYSNVVSTAADKHVRDAPGDLTVAGQTDDGILGLGALERPPRSGQCRAPIPFAELGAMADTQYQGDGLSVLPVQEGARLRCVFQKLEGLVTAEGLWLISTANGARGDRFRVVATSVGSEVRERSTAVGDALAAGHQKMSKCCGRDCDQSRVPLVQMGRLTVLEKLARFVRPGLVEEYSVSVDGVRQDFLVLERPVGEGLLRVGLDVAGAKAEALVDGARLVLDASGRNIAYSRLRVVDAQGRQLAARMEVASVNCLAVLVDDAAAAYPVRIDPTFSDANWVSMGGVPGADGFVNAVVVDGSGNLYIGGDFVAVGEVVANYVAKWDGSAWSALGSGLSQRVLALATSGNDLYAGGVFTAASGAAANYIAKWDGSTWSALGLGLNSSPAALAISGTDLYAGGSFTMAGGAPANRVAKWDGNAWSALGSGIAEFNTTVYALAVLGTDLYVGGDFATAGGAGAAAGRIARWNGSTWSALGSGLFSAVGKPEVRALAVSGNDLYVGGAFTTAGGIAATNIAKWNGSAWSALGSIIGGTPYPLVYALSVTGTNLYVGGVFTSAGSSAATNIAKWDGSAWSAVGSDLRRTAVFPVVYALAAFGSNLYAGGIFTSAGGLNAGYIARRKGSNWLTLGSRQALGARATAVAVSGSDLYVGGDFTSAGGSMANHIAKWDGSAWSPLGSGLNGNVLALAVSGGDLFVGGAFTTAGGSPATNIAKWDGNGWSALGSGLNDQTLALAVSGSDLYAGGVFTAAGSTAANYIAKWDGSAWSALGSGLDYDGSQGGTGVFAVAVLGSNLYVGGIFKMAGGSASTNIARWDGNAWSGMGSGLNSSLVALAVSGSNLYAGGFFTEAGGVAANYIAKWDGSAWSALGSGLNRVVRALAVSGSDLYVGGDFTSAGGSAATNIAKWDGSAWSALGSGLGARSFPRAHALAVSGTDLYVGGNFTMAGGKVSAYLATADLAGDTAPILTIRRSANTAVLSWPSPSIGFALQQNFIVGTTNWISIVAIPADDGTNKSITVLLDSGGNYFRLKK